MYKRSKPPRCDCKQPATVHVNSAWQCERCAKLGEYRRNIDKVKLIKTTKYLANQAPYQEPYKVHSYEVKTSLY